MKLSNIELFLLESLMNEAIDAMSYNSCNDHAVEVTAENRENLRRLIIEMDPHEEELRDDLERLDETANGDEIYLVDFDIARFLLNKILKAHKE